MIRSNPGRKLTNLTTAQDGTIGQIPNQSAQSTGSVSNPEAVTARGSTVYPTDSSSLFSLQRITTGLGRAIAPAVAAVMLATSGVSIAQGQTLDQLQSSNQTTIEQKIDGPDIKLDDRNEIFTALRLVSGLTQAGRLDAAEALLDELDLSEAYSSQRDQAFAVRAEILEARGDFSGARAAYEQITPQSSSSKHDLLGDIARVMAADPTTTAQDLADVLYAHELVGPDEKNVLARAMRGDNGEIIRAITTVLEREPTTETWGTLVPLLTGAIAGDVLYERKNTERLPGHISDVRQLAERLSGTEIGSQTMLVADALEEIQSGDYEKAASGPTVELAALLPDNDPLLDFLDLYTMYHSHELGKGEALDRMLKVAQLKPESGSARISAMEYARKPGVDLYGAAMKEVGAKVPESVLHSMGEFDLAMQTATHRGVAGWLIERNGETPEVAPALIEQYEQMTLIEEIRANRDDRNVSPYIFEKLADAQRLAGDYESASQTEARLSVLQAEWTLSQAQTKVEK